MHTTQPPQPAVLIVGGFATVPQNYWPMRRRVAERGVERVDVAPIWPPDWAIAGLFGLGPLMMRTARSIVRTYRAGGRRPIVVVGHSGGGILARLAMSSVPFDGRVAGVAEAVGCLVTLGTPHGLAHLTNRYRHAGHVATEFLEATSPGAFCAPRTGYVSVGSSFPSAPAGGSVGWLLEQVFSIVVGDETAQLGDGIVPAAAVHLDGAQQITFADVRHGVFGAPWYGDDISLDRWWPVALESWRAALEARSAAARGAPAAPRRRSAAHPVETGLAAAGFGGRS
jgi:hypothetical protein